MDGSNVGWWVPVLAVAVPLLLLLGMHLLARLEAWMFSSDERAAKVAKLLEQVDTPDQVEQEVTRLLAEVTDRRGGSEPDGRTRRAPQRRRHTDRRAATGRAPGGLRLRRAVARSSTSDTPDGGSR